MSQPTIAIAGALAQKPWVAGHTWVFLQYVRGLQRLGYDVLFIDRLDAGMSVDAAGQPCDAEVSVNLRYFLDVAEAFGFSENFAILVDDGTTIGLTRDEVCGRLRQSVGLINVMGYLQDEELLACPPRRVFLDIDPGVGQMWRDLGLADLFAGHDAFVTIGENIGDESCDVPTCGLPWITTRQPVVLEDWPVTPAPANGTFTSVATWRGTYGPIERDGRVYGQRVHEFRRFIDIPQRTGRAFSLALDIDDGEVHDLELLQQSGWQLLRPRDVAATPDTYRRFIQRSRAEFLVAKNIVVQARCGWMSDRSICYLASGRPVLVQDTGLAPHYPVGTGLVTYTNPDEAAAGVEAICEDYDAHAEAARAIAETHFDANKVLGRLVQVAGLH